MLSAAFDILKKDFGTGNGTAVESNNTRCNPTSTGAILLADILPSLTVKVIAPFLNINTHVRVMLVVFLSSASFLLTSFTVAQWMSFVGVISASISSGLGEITFLQYSSKFDKDVISTWSSGTGGAGVLGALSYAAITSVMSPENTLLVMLVIPVLLAVSFWIILEHPKPRQKLRHERSSDPIILNVDDSKQDSSVASTTFVEKVKLIKPLLKYMIPLGLVYFAEYFINQGLLELIEFNNLWLDHSEQYRWLQVDYQLGVLISRSSVNFIQIHKLWLLPILQIINAILLFFEAYYLFLPSFWIVIAVVFYEGLLGGCAYVNTFYKISQEIPPKDREFSLGIASLADGTGIAIAGAVSLPMHDALCLLKP